MEEINSPQHRWDQVSGNDIKILKETLCSQQKLLKKLYNDLEVEREAASSAASEALSMILKLQGEKAAVKMEANQYKRMAEEKMCHAEEAIAIFEDVIYQKEMEIVSLEYQLQSYRYKLVSMGCDDIGEYEFTFPEHLLQRNDRTSGENIGGGQMGLRRNSMPPNSSFKFFDQKKGLVEGSDLIPETEEDLDIFKDADADSDVENKQDEDVMAGNDMNMYWEQIQKLNERLKGITGWGGDNSLEPNSKEDQDQNHEQHQEKEKEREQEEQQHHDQPVFSLLRGNSMTPSITTTHKPASPSKVHDVFEVPQSEGNNTLSRSVPQPLTRMATEKVKKIMNLQAPHAGKRLMTRSTETMLVSDHPYSIEIGESQTSSQPIRPPKVKGCKKCNNLGDFGALVILKDIQEKVNSIQLDIRSLKADQNNRSSSSSSSTRLHDQPNLNNLSEVMLHFWL